MEGERNQATPACCPTPPKKTPQKKVPGPNPYPVIPATHTELSTHAFAGGTVVYAHTVLEAKKEEAESLGGLGDRREEVQQGGCYES